MTKYNIPFSPPDITEAEIAEVADTLRSGWITTGPKTKELERRLSVYTQTPKTVCLNSATAALELILRVLEVGPGDEVIVPAMTYTASCSVITHVGATPVMVDIQDDTFEMDYDKLEQAITEKTKVIIPVELAGITSLASINYKDEDAIISQMTAKGMTVDQAYVERVLPEKMHFNLAYLRDFSFIGDIKIMLQTVVEVLK